MRHYYHYEKINEGNSHWMFIEICSLGAEPPRLQQHVIST